MNNTAYVPPSGDRALSVTPLQEALISRMRPFGLTAADLKEISPSPFLPSLGLMRPEGLPGFPLHSAVSPFLHPALESRLPGLSSGAFRPIFSMAGPGDSTNIIKSFPSAFQPPCGRSDKLHGSSLFSPGHNIFPRMSPTSSKSSPSTSPLIKTDENSNTEQHNEDISRTAEEEEDRPGKRPRIAGLYGCPICGQGLTPSDLESHLDHELDLLTKISIISPDLIHHKFAMSPGLDQAPRNRWDSFQRIQRNRQSRIRLKLSRRAGRRQDEVLEEEEVRAVAQTEDHIDIVGETGEDRKPAERKQGERKAVKRGGFFGPEQFTEEEVQAGAAGEAGEEEEREDGGEEAGHDPTRWCSQCQGGLKEAAVSLVCWHVHCQKCWFSSLNTKKACRECGTAAKPADLRRVFL